MHFERLRALISIFTNFLDQVMTPEQAGQFVVPLITKAARDAVPNVRFCALQILMKLVKAEKVQSITMSGTIKPVVTELVTDALKKFTSQ